ncbi:hypothetical protein ACLBWP_10150 [Microbacterium sp. M1A1_1b]
MTQQHDAQTPPFRFRTPPGWPTPSAEWVALHQLAVPGPQWTPVPGVPTAPAGWRFWQADRRAFRAAMPAAARRLAAVGGVGVGLLALGIVLAVVLTASDAPAVFALVPLALGAALWVVPCVRWWDLAATTERALAAESAARRPGAVLEHARAARPDLGADQAVAAWTAAAWGVETAAPLEAPAVRSARPVSAAGFLRASRTATGVTVVLAAVALVVGAGAGVAPVAVRALDTGQTIARGMQDGAGGDAPDTAAPFTSDDGTVTVTEDDDAWDDTCGTTPGDGGCWTWQVTSTKTCNLEVTIGFADTLTGDDTRTVRRTVQVSKDRPLYIAEPGDEDYSGIEATTCATALPHRLVTGESDDPIADSEWPEGCDASGCVGWVLHPEADCTDASVQFLVDDSDGPLEDPHDLVVSAELHAGDPVTVVAGGVPDDDGTASIVQVTCAVTGGAPADPSALG